ncbi:MAG TPA: hypothetical protein IAA84_13425 [Candidatus Alectryocaccomicrobium excrementavium]|uniref:DUF6199 domain-containing protein n=1 Tax=Candidatus Alectryocaccomicrobium excrementavium TaxID=2840668 RepID=A0A9D1G2M4_9FIRM|nr:hypothetical protein [Candidatus Alectryocaccomicrobium excrementavium]
MRKWLVIGVAVFVALAVAGVYCNARQGVWLGGAFYAQTSEGTFAAGGDRIAIERAENGARFTGEVAGEALDAQLTQNDGRIRVEMGENVVEGYPSDGGLVDDEGLPLAWSQGITVSAGDEEPPVHPYVLADALYGMYAGATEPRGEWGMVWIYALLYWMGLAAILWPEETHFLFSRWAYRNAELSDAGIAMQRLGGGVAMAASVVVLFLPLFIH